MMHSNSAEGLYYGNSQLEYRYQDGTPRFYTNWSTGNGYFYGNLGVGVISPLSKLQVGTGGVRFEGPASANSDVPALSMGGFGDLQVDAPGAPGGRFTIKENGNVGIGHINPQAPLSFGSFTGKKISFYGDGEPYYGIGVQGYLLQIHTDLPESDIAFGHGSSDLFNETMRIKGTGNVGIGTVTPSEKLEANGNVKATSYKYSTPKTYYYSVPPCAFDKERDSDTIARSWSFVSFNAVLHNTSNYMTAPVNLPHGATITAFTVYYQDISATKNLVIDLFRHVHSEPILVLSIAEFTSSGTPGNTSAVVPVSPGHLVNNQQASYSIRASADTGTPGAWPGYDLQIRGVVITYTLSEAQ
jgi:hypothetical protein